MTKLATHTVTKRTQTTTNRKLIKTNQKLIKTFNTRTAKKNPKSVKEAQWVSNCSRKDLWRIYVSLTVS